MAIEGKPGALAHFRFTMPLEQARSGSLEAASQQAFDGLQQQKTQELARLAERARAPQPEPEGPAIAVMPPPAMRQSKRKSAWPRRSSTASSVTVVECSAGTGGLLSRKTGRPGQGQQHDDCGKPCGHTFRLLITWDGTHRPCP